MKRSFYRWLNCSVKKKKKENFANEIVSFEKSIIKEARGKIEWERKKNLIEFLNINFIVFFDNTNLFWEWIATRTHRFRYFCTVQMQLYHTMRSIRWSQLFINYISLLFLSFFSFITILLQRERKRKSKVEEGFHDKLNFKNDVILAARGRSYIISFRAYILSIAPSIIYTLMIRCCICRLKINTVLEIVRRTSSKSLLKNMIFLLPLLHLLVKNAFHSDGNS